ncbi:GntR family transcriptional regulator [Pseudomonas sp. Marseille-QA0892]
MQGAFHHDTKPSSAEDEAYRYVLDALRSGQYAPGDRLIADDIASHVGVSRMPVRSAFQRLAAEGLVTLRPNRGAIVKGLDLADMQEVFEMRSALEGLAIRLATPQMTPRALNRLERLLDELDESQGNPAEWVTQHRAFHEYLCSLANRPRLLGQISGLYALIEPYMRLWLTRAAPPSSARDEHRLILDALRAGDPVAAESELQEHIGGTVPELFKFIEANLRTEPLAQHRPFE